MEEIIWDMQCLMELFEILEYETTDYTGAMDFECDSIKSSRGLVLLKHTGCTKKIFLSTFLMMSFTAINTK